jgi:hypothetical protein
MLPQQPPCLLGNVLAGIFAETTKMPEGTSYGGVLAVQRRTGSPEDSSSTPTGMASTMPARLNESRQL